MEPLSASTILGGLVLGSTFAISSMLVGDARHLVDIAVNKVLHPNPEKEQEEEVEKIMNQINRFDRPLANLDEKTKIKN